MADATARRCYADETRPVEIKQKAWEGSAAHHEHVGAKNETGEATVTRVDIDSGHGIADFIDGGVPATAVGKTSKQQVIEHHKNKTELMAYQAQAETDRGALATAKRARRRCCRPRGRKAASGGSRWTQATTVGGMGSQGGDGAGTLLC